MLQSSAVLPRPRTCVFVLLAALALPGCGGEKGGETPNAGPMPVTTLQVQPRPTALVLGVVGRTEGSKEVELRARVSGILEKRVYTEGAPVKAGAVMFQIDRAPFQIALAHARAALAGEQARNQQARRNADRLRELVGQHLVSRSDADNAISALEASDASMLAAQADVREAELNLSYTSVVAPIAGVAGRALHSEGSLVTAGTDSSLLTTVTQTDPLWVRFALSESEYAQLRALDADGRERSNLSVALERKDGATYPEPGKLNFAGSTVDAELGTVQLRAEFPNARLDVLPGEYVQVRLSGATAPGIAVPQTAVLQGDKGPFVWIVNGQGQAEQRPVQTGAWIGSDWRIEGGLAAGDMLIVDNLLRLRPGIAVKAQAAGQPATPPAPAASTAAAGSR